MGLMAVVIIVVALLCIAWQIHSTMSIYKPLRWVLVLNLVAFSLSTVAGFLFNPLNIG